MFARIGENLRQPKPFYVIFSIEMWERFGFYGMQSLLVYYMIHTIGYSDAKAFDVYAALVALVYGFMSIGGFIGDKVLGIQRTIILGACFLAAGYFLLGMGKEPLLFLGMGCIAVGNGFFKSNPSSLLSKCYREGDPRIDGSFTLYYMAINIGAFVSIIVAPIVAAHYSWSIGFWVSSIGLVIALIYFISLRSWMAGIDSPVGLKPLSWLRLGVVLAGGVVVAFIASWLLLHLSVAHWLLLLIGIIILILFGRLIVVNKGRVRANLIVALVLMLEAVAYFVINLQMSTSLTLYAVHNINTHVLGLNLSPLSFQSLDALWILIASPVLAYFYTHFGRRGKDFSLPTKFTIGMFICAIGFLIAGCSKFFGGTTGLVSAWWLVILYLFLAVSELLISGLGLAMVSKLVPQSSMGFMMGVWWMTLSAGSVISGFVAGIASVPADITNPVQTLPIYTHLFFEIGECTLIFAVLMLLLTPMLNKALK